MSSFFKLNGSESIVFAAGFRALNCLKFGFFSMKKKKKTRMCTWLHYGRYRPYSSICADPLILSSSLLSYSPVSLPQVPPAVKSITGISTSYLLHCAVVTSHTISPTPSPPHPLWCSPGHSPIMQEPWWPGYISPIPSVAGTLASHLLCSLLSRAPLLSLPSHSRCFAFPSSGSSSFLSLIFILVWSNLVFFSVSPSFSLSVSFHRGLIIP